MSRYYSQPYARLDDPDWNPNTSTENLHDNSSYEHYRSEPQYSAVDTPLKESTLPSSYLNSKYPQPGLKGLTTRSKGWFAWSEWSRRRKLIIVGSLIALVIIIAIIIAAAVTTLSGSDFSYTPPPPGSTVTNEAAFASGGASRVVPPKNNDGIGAGEDKYVYYEGDASNFPPSSEWISYQQMWTNNLPTIQGSCSTLGDGDDDR